MKSKENSQQSVKGNHKSRSELHLETPSSRGTAKNGRQTQDKNFPTDQLEKSLLNEKESAFIQARKSALNYNQGNSNFQTVSPNNEAVEDPRHKRFVSKKDDEKSAGGKSAEK